MAEKDIEKKWQEWASSILEQLIDLDTRYEILSREISAKNESLSKELNEKFKDLTVKIEKNTTILMGNGEPSKGIVIRVDRLEQSESRRGWWIKSILGACLAAVITSIFAYFKKP